MQFVPETARKLAQEFIEFVNVAVTPFHVVEQCSLRLRGSGFSELRETDNWQLKAGGKYFFTRNLTTLIAFIVGEKFDTNNTGFKIIGAHTDSPCLRLAPVSKLSQNDMHQACVTTYGGGLWHTWFDRELSLGGRIVYKNDKTYEEKLFSHPYPLMKIPNLAIHLQTADERSKFGFNPETHLRPIIASQIYSELTGLKNPDNVPQKHYSQLYDLIEKSTGIKAQDIVDLDFYLHDTQPAQFFGIQGEFVSSPRIDNLVSSFLALRSLTQPNENLSSSSFINMVCLFDHEEIGSQSAQGADSNIIPSIMERIYKVLSDGSTVVDSFYKTLNNSFIISADMAHGIHPNYPDRHQVNHKVSMNKGVVIKINYGQRYATDAVSGGLIRAIADIAQVPVQDFIVKNDSPCGSTIGPLIASQTGIKTVDVGIPQWSMHSIRETAGVLDFHYYHNFFHEFFRSFDKINHKLLGI